MARYKEIDYPKTQVKKAGRVFASPNSTQEEKDAARVVINNWRAAHAFPLQIIYCNLKRNVDNSFIVAQRLKRLESITKKLSRFPNMTQTSHKEFRLKALKNKGSQAKKYTS